MTPIGQSQENRENISATHGVEGNQTKTLELDESVNQAADFSLKKSSSEPTSLEEKKIQIEKQTMTREASIYECCNSYECNADNFIGNL